MSLKQRIEQDIKKAMLGKNKDELRALRSIKSKILLAETEKGKSGGLTEDDENKLLMKEAKQRKESADIYKKQKREDLHSVEIQEFEIINRYLPKPLSEEELDRELKKIIGELGADNPKDMGKVMGVASKRLSGKADGKTIANRVKSLLEN